MRFSDIKDGNNDAGSLCMEHHYDAGLPNVRGLREPLNTRDELRRLLNIRGGLLRLPDDRGELRQLLHIRRELQELLNTGGALFMS